MRKITSKLILFTIFLFSLYLEAQVGIGTTNPHTSSALEITSTNSGILIPRMTQAQKNAISSPATGLLVYQTDGTAGFYYYSGSAWTPFTNSGWNTTGNSGTTCGTNFVGTTDSQDLALKANNIEGLRIKTDGNVGIGTTSPGTKLHVEGTITSSSLLSDGFEDGTLSPFSTSGTGGNWTITTTAGEYKTGSRGAKSSGGTHSSTSDLTYTTIAMTNSGTVQFSYKTSSESFDKLYFYIDGVSQGSWGGTTAWTTVSFPLTSGTHTLKWSYQKDISTHTGSDRVYVDDISISMAGNGLFKLVDGNQSSGKVLTSDANGFASWQTAGSGSGTSYTFTNGLTETSGTVKLGGSLIENTTIAANSNTFKVSTTGKSNMFVVDPTYDVVRFGASSTLSGNGTNFDVNGDIVTVNYLTSPYNGNSRGTAIGAGSIEFFVDGESVIASSDSFLPIEDNTLDLGSSVSRWNDAYIANGVTSTSDERLKKDIKPLQYGLAEVLKLKPIRFKWKSNDNEKVAKITEKDKIGFSAQDLLKVLPEVVKTHDWKKLDEKSEVYSYVENKNLGVMYSDIIPVLVKAIQEQQTQVDTKKTTLEELKLQNELLKKIINKGAN